MPQQSFYKGTRGEWYVVIQVILMALVFFGPRGSHGWRFLPTMFGTGAGLFLFISGLTLLLASIPKHGKNLTPAPHPTKNATLIQTGPYRIVRHPMYSGGIFVSFGFALLVHSWLTVVYAVLLTLFADIKSRREERWLVEKFPEYPAYQKRVKKLVPGVY
jgi:protein-S-isoprenylcysteine O-methyltransferase Ste14